MPTPVWYDASPAYGRDYKSQKEVLADWHAQKDFQIHQGGSSTYINKQDKPDHVGLTVRYHNGTKVMVIK